MNKNTAEQCPNCKQYKMANMGGVWKIGLSFFLGIPAIIVWFFISIFITNPTGTGIGMLVIVVVIAAIMMSGNRDRTKKQMTCSNCGYKN